MISAVGIPRSNSCDVEYTFLGPLHCEPISLMSVGQHSRNVGRHPNEGSLVLSLRSKEDPTTSSRRTQ